MRKIACENLVKKEQISFQLFHFCAVCNGCRAFYAQFPNTVNFRKIVLYRTVIANIGKPSNGQFQRFFLRSCVENIGFDFIINRFQIIGYRFFVNVQRKKSFVIAERTFIAAFRLFSCGNAEIPDFFGFGLAIAIINSDVTDNINAFNFLNQINQIGQSHLFSKFCFAQFSSINKSVI